MNISASAYLSFGLKSRQAVPPTNNVWSQIKKQAVHPNAMGSLSVSLFLQVFQTLAHDGMHMVIRKGIDNIFAFPAESYQTALLEHPQLMGN